MVSVIVPFKRSSLINFETSVAKNWSYDELVAVYVTQNQLMKHLRKVIYRDTVGDWVAIRDKKKVFDLECLANIDATLWLNCLHSEILRRNKKFLRLRHCCLPIPVIVARANTHIASENVHLRIEDKINLRVDRGGGLQLFELDGLLTLKVADEKYGKIKVHLENIANKSIQLKAHSQLDMELFRSTAQIGLKKFAKPFPINTDVVVLKWCYKTQDESAIPLTINCWPSNNGEGGCDVNIQYKLEHQHLQLQDVSLTIPLPNGCHPNVVDCGGDFNYDQQKNRLIWNISTVDKANPTGSMEFSCPSAIPGDFFPVDVTFVSKIPYFKLKVKEVTKTSDNMQIPFSVKTVFFPIKYDIV